MHGSTPTLVKPRVTEVVVCNPRKNALLKDGSKSDRIDARKLAEQLYLNNIKSVFHGEHRLRTWKELAQLSDHHQGSHAGHESTEGVVSQLGHSVFRRRSVCITSPFGMARAKSVKPASGNELNTTISNSMSSGSCVRRCDGICWGKRRSTRPRNCNARFRGLVRSAAEMLGVSLRTSERPIALRSFRFVVWAAASIRAHVGRGRL